MPVKELVITVSRVVMLISVLIVLFLAAMISHRPVSAQNGETVGERLIRQEQRMETQEQALRRIEAKLQKMEDSLASQTMAFTELKTVVYTGAGLLAFLLAGQLVVSLRKKP